MRRPSSSELLRSGALAGGTAAIAAAGFALSKFVERRHESQQPAPVLGSIHWRRASRAQLESPFEYAQAVPMPRGRSEAGYYAILGATLDSAAGSAMHEDRPLMPVIVRHFPHGDGSHSYDIGTSIAFMRAATNQAATPGWDGMSKVAVRINADPTLFYVAEQREDGIFCGRQTDVIGVMPFDELANSKQFPGLVIAQDLPHQG